MSAVYYFTPQKGAVFDRAETSTSIAKRFPLPRDPLCRYRVYCATLQPSRQTHWREFTLGQAISIIPVIGDHFNTTNPAALSLLGNVSGYRPMLLIGIPWFSRWSLVRGLAAYSNHVLFIFARVFATYKLGWRKIMIFAIFSMAALGGSILGSLHLIIILAAVVVLRFYAIPPCPPGPRQEKSMGFVSIMNAIDFVGTVIAPMVSWGYACLRAAHHWRLVSLVGFSVYEIRYALMPLINLSPLTRDASFVLAAVACGRATFGIWFFYTWGFHLNICQKTPLLATVMIVSVAISGAAAALFTDFVLHRLGPPIIVTGVLVAFTIRAILPQKFVSIVPMPQGMDTSFPASTLILSNPVPRKHQGIAASLVTTVINYSISLSLGFAGTVEVHVNNGRQVVLRGYRGAFYFGIRLSVLEIIVLSNEPSIQLL
ncbi:hypothetical protein HD806DRAFT_524774 [Xylariaceae sp. AK1471]|nr:hypothetical protein HD806DRAFT_524774 [Xylariaceae sp. AK1471]